MNTSLRFREVLGRVPFLVDELDSLGASISGTFAIEHRDDGTHGFINGLGAILDGDVDISGDLAVGGRADIDFNGNITAGINPVSRIPAATEIGSVGSSVPNDGWLGAGVDMASKWAAGQSGGGTDYSWRVTDLVGGQTPLMVRKFGGGSDYFLQPGFVSRSAGMVAYIGNPNDSFAGGWWDGVYSLKYYRNSSTVAEGDWQTYTPTLTNITIGNGSIAAKYAKNGNVVHVEVLIVFGSTTTIAAGALISLPTNNTAGSSAQILGSTGMFDVSAGIIYRGTALVNSATDLVLYQSNTPLALVTNNLPFIWTTSDQLTASLVYQGV